MEIAQISIGTGLDLSGAMRDLKRFGTNSNASVKIKAEVDDRALTDLNKHLTLKQVHVRAVAKDFKTNVIRPTVDDRALTTLNKSLDATQGKLRGIVASAKELEGIGNIKVSASSSGSTNTQANDKLADSIGRAVARHSKSSSNQGTQSDKSLNRVERATQKVEAATRSNKPSFLGGVGQGLAQSFGQQLAGGIQSSLRKELGIDFRTMGKKSANNVIAPVKGLITENPELKKTFDRITSRLEKQTAEFGQTFADALINATDSLIASINESAKVEVKKTTSGTEGGSKTQTNKTAEILRTFAKDVFSGVDGKNLVAEIALEAKKSGKEIAQSVAKSPYAKGKIAEVGEVLTQRREDLLRERAIPLVQKRSAEILAQKRSKNSANLVNDQTKEAVIMTGGYAKARGLSAADMEKRLGREFGEEVVRIWTKNTDTDISQGIDGGRKAAEIGWSLAKPNIRGYSNDAVEMASQGLAALERNPEIKIKLIGESGGGFVVEEAARILELMGVAADRLEFIGVGTPEYIGSPKATTGKKIISPDESLGAEVQGMHAAYGFSPGASNEILGLKGHPIVHYVEAKVAELENFFSNPDFMSSSDIGQVKDVASQFKATDTSEMSRGELEKFSEASYRNLQLIRRQLLVATEDTVEELRLIAKDFEQVYVATSEEPNDLKQIRQFLKQANGILSNLEANRGVQSGNTARAALVELKQIQAEFNEKYEGSVGTLGLKSQALSDELNQVIQRFDDPSLSVKARTPVVMPDVMKDEIDVVPEIGELEESKGFIAKVKEAIVIRAQNDIERVKDGIEGAFVNKLNDKLMRVPGNPDLLDPSRQVGGADELRGADYLKIARVEMEDVLRTMLSAGSQRLSVAQGAENVLMGAVPPLKLVKGVAQKIALPAAVFGAAGALPGVGAAEGAMSGGIEALLGLPAEQLASAMSGGFADAVNITIGNIPAIGGKLAPALTEAVTQLLLNAAGTAANVGAELITPVVGGQLMMGGAGQAVKSVLPAIPDQQIAANRQLQATTEQQIKILGRGIETAKALMSVNPEKSQRYIAGIQRDYPQIGGQINEAIGALPAASRMSEESGGGELARLKASFSKAQKDLENAEQKANKLGAIVAGWAEIIQNPMEAMQRQVQNVEDIIDVDFEEVRPQLALPDAQKGLQKQFDAMVAAAAGQVRDLGEELSRQAKTLKSGNLSPEVKAEIAAAIDSTIASSRSAVDAVVDSFGGRVPAEVRKAAQSSRQRITKSGTSAQSTLNESKQAGVAIPDGLNVGVESRLSELQKTAESMAVVVISAVENKLEIRSPSRVFEGIGQMVVKGFEMGLEGFRQATSFVDDFLEQVESKFDLAQGTFKGFAGTIKTVAFAFAAFQAVQTLIPMFQSIASEVLTSAMEFEKFERQLNFVTGSASKTQATLKSLSAEAKALGGDFKSAIAGQAQLAAATKGTSLEGAATDQIGSATRQASSVFGLTTEEADRVNLAITQMASKGKVSAEELRGQLGEVLPGAFQIFARSIGVTTAQLDAMLQRGEVGTDSLVKFAAQLKAETSTGVAGAANSAQASLNRFNNEIYAMQVSFGKALLPVQSLGLGALTTALQALGVILPVVSVAAIGFGTKALLAMGVNALTAGVGVGALGKGLLALPGSMLKATAAFAPFAAQVAVFVLIADAIGILGKMYGETEGASKDFATSATKGLNDYLKLTGEATDKTKKLADSINDLPKSYAEEGMIGGLAKGIAGDRGTGFLRQREQDIGRGGRSDTGSDIARLFGIFNGKSESSSNPLFKTRSEKESEDLLKQNQEANKASSELQRRLNDQISRFAQGGGSIRQVRNIDTRMRDLQAKRGLLGSGDDTGRAAIDKEYNQLAKDRENLSAQVNALNAQVKANVEARKAANKQIEDALKGGGQSPAQTAKLRSQFEANTKAIEEGELSLKEYAKAINTAIVGAAKLEAQLQAINTEAAYRDNRIQLGAAQSQGAIALAQTNNALTPGQAQSAQAASDQASQTQTIESLNTTIAQLNSLLTSPTTSRAFGLSGLSPNSNSAEIGKYISEFTGDTSSEEFKILQEAQTQKQQLEQLQVQSAQAATQLQQSQLQTQESIKQTTKEINDYVKGIGQNIEDIGRTIESQDLDAQIQQTKNDLHRNLSGFSDRFFGDFIGGLDQLIDLINEPLKRMQEAQGQIAGMARSLNDAQKQGGELIRNAQSGASAFAPGMASQAYNIQNPDGSRVNSVRDLAPHHDYQSKDGRNVYDMTLVDQNNNDRVAVPSAFNGTVDYVGNDPSGYGNFVDVRDLNGAIARFAHLAEVTVKVGQQVMEGQSVGLQGTTGGSTGVHLHAELPPQYAERYVQRLAQGGVSGGGSSSGQSSTPTASIQSGTFGGVQLNAEQVRNAAIIAKVGREVGASPRDIQIALATAMQESTLQNLDYGDADSVGLFQQRSSMEWGTNAQIMNPEYSAKAFFQGAGSNSGLLDLQNRNSMSVAQAAQATQRSAYPDAYAKWEEMSGALASQLGAGGSSGGGSMISVPGADTSAINPALNQYSQALDAQTQSILSQVAAQDERTAIELRQGIESSRQKLTDAQRTIIDETQQYNQRYQDSILAAFGDSPIAQALQQLSSDSRDVEESTRNMTRTIEDATLSLDNLTKVRNQIANDPSLKPLQELIPGMDATIAQYEGQIDQIELARDREQRILNDRRNAILDNLESTGQQELSALQSQTEDLRIQQQAAMIPDSQLKDMVNARSQRLALTREFEASTRAIDVELERVSKGLERLKAEGFAVDSDEIAIATRQLENLNAQRDQLEQGNSIQLQLIDQSQLDLLRQYTKEQDTALMSAQVEFAGYSSDTFGSNQLQFLGARNQLMEDYKTKMNSINQLEIQMQGQAGYSAEKFAEMRTSLVEFTNVSLDSLKQQFPDLATTLNTTAFQAFQGLSGSISAVIKGTGTLEDAFDAFSSTIIDRLVEMGIQWASNELFGSFMGGGKSSGGLAALLSPTASGAGGGGDTISSILSTGISLLGGLDNGGLIGGRYSGKPDQHIARVNPGEFVFSREATAFHSPAKLSAMNNLQRFDDGGYVGSYDDNRPVYKDYTQGATGDSSPIQVEYNVTEINSVRYVSEEQFQRGLVKTSEQTEKRMNRSMRSSPSYRNGIGI